MSTRILHIVIYPALLFTFISCDLPVSSQEKAGPPQVPPFEQLNAESSYFSEERLAASDILSIGNTLITGRYTEKTQPMLTL